MDLIRQILDESRISAALTNENIIDEINAYFERQTDRDEVRSAIKARYGVGITREDDPASAENPYQVYAKGEFNAMVDSGLIEAISIGWGQKIISALATLFTEKGQRYDLVSDTDTDTDTTDSQTYMSDIRERGGYDSSIVDADRKSIQCGAGAVFVTAKHGGLKYQVLTPADVRFYWPISIIDHEGNKWLPDYTDAEDAYAITIRLSMIDQSKFVYLAIFGRSEDWPEGRWCEYTGSPNDMNLPTLGQKDSDDFMIDGAPANPLSYQANRIDSDDRSPDYPISIITGQTSSRATPMPTYTTLYQDDKEFTLTASHLLSKTNTESGTTKVLSVGHDGVANPLPKTLDGAITLLPGQSMEPIPGDCENVKAGYETLNMEEVEAAAAYSVPDYMMASDDSMYGAESGIALQVKTRPLVKERQRRERANREAVIKIFDIEKALLNLHYDRPEDKALLNLSLEWSAGNLEMPENKKEKAERIISLIKSGVYDTIAGIRELNNFASDGEAEEEYEKMRARSKKFPPLVTEAKPAVGTTFRSRQAANNA